MSEIMAPGHRFSKENLILHPPARPKADIAAFLATKGIRVPWIFDDKESAVSYWSNQPIVLRSEHPQDMNGMTGASGLFESHVFDADNFVNATTGKPPEPGKEILERYLPYSYFNMQPAAFEQLLRERASKTPKIANYVDDMSLDAGTFIGQLNHSYWQYIHGINCSLVADNAVANRFHIFSSWNEEGSPDYNYTCFDNGKATLSGPAPIPPGLHGSFEEILRMYSSIQYHLSCQESCPLVELQIDPQNTVYFLQALFLRDQMLAGPFLENEQNSPAVKAQMVRGSTPPEGVDMKVVVTDFITNNSLNTLSDLKKTDLTGKSLGVFTWEGQNPYWETIFSKAKAVFLSNPYDIKELPRLLANTHFSHSLFFKPPLTVVISEEGTREMIKKAKKSPSTNLTTVDVNVVSDGRSAFVRF